MFSPIQNTLDRLHEKYRDVQDGTVADYIPELAKADPNWFGISLVTCDGHVYEAGDTRQMFTIQSISKAFVYGVALEDNGLADVMKRVGVEPTGDAFNSISLDPVTGRPANPMVNAGAIATTGLAEGKTAKQKIYRIMDALSRYCGRPLEIDESVYQSEAETGHRNRAIAHLLRNFDMVEGDPEAALDAYFMQCSINVTCTDLALMGATLANGGVNPVTGSRALVREYVESVLGVMSSCGMYDYAGEWIFKVGMPAKSGVGGGIVAVLPGQLGIGVFSPALDERFNSVRGIQVCRDLSRMFDLHMFNAAKANESVIRLRYTAAELSSKRSRTKAERDILHKTGDGAWVYELQGELVFGTTERVVRDVVKVGDALRYVVIDLRRVIGLDESSCLLFRELIEELHRDGKVVLFTHTKGLRLFRRYMRANVPRLEQSAVLQFELSDYALEWCEDQLLKEAEDQGLSTQSLSRDKYELFCDLTPEELAHIEPLLERCSFAEDQIICKTGEASDALYFLAQGQVSVRIPLQAGGYERLATFSSGMVFGEVGALDGLHRSADVVADTPLQCDRLPASSFEGLSETHPQLKIKLLESLVRRFCQDLRRANQEASVFS